MFKLISGKHNDDLEFEPNIYNNGVQFVVPHLKRRTISICADFNSCREIFLGNLREALFGLDEFDGYKISRSFLPVLFLYGNMSAGTATKQFETSIKFINMFEECLGWAKTVGHTDIDSSDMTMEDDNNDCVPVFDKEHAVYLTISTKQWLKAPQLLSFYILIMRMVRTPGLSNANNLEEFNKIVSSCYKKRGDFSNDTSKDLVYYWENLIKIELILKYYKQLFSSRSINYTWEPVKYSNGWLDYNQIEEEGISNLCNGLTYDKPLAYKFKRLCDANNIEHTIEAEWS